MASGKGNMPFAIVPTQQVAAAGSMSQLQGAYPSTSGRVSPPRMQTQNVDLQFNHVVSQRQHFDKELEDMKRLLDVKSRECDELNDKISKMSEYCEQDKTRLSQEKERLKDEHAADLAREQAAFDRDRKELSDLLSEQRNQVRLLTKEAKSQQIIAAERANSLLQENKRLEALADQCKSESNRAVNEMELKLDTQASYVAECEKELSLKDAQVKKAKREVADATGNLEKVANQLISRSKERDGEILRRQHQYEADARRASDEMQALTLEKTQLVRDELHQKEENLLLKGQWDKAQTVIAELQQEIQSLTARLEAKGEAENITSREVGDALQQLEGMKQENNTLHGMNDRLNEQLRMAQEEAARSDEQTARLRDEACEAEEGFAGMQRERAAHTAKVLRLVEATMEETSRLVGEVDAFRMVVREAALQHAPEEARDMEMEILREQGREADLHAKRQQQGGSLVPHGDEAAVATLLARLREDIVIGWEDLRVVKSDVKDEISRFNDLNAQYLALKEAYVVDREHLATLTANLNEANTAYAKVQKEKGLMQESLREHDDRMKEFVSLSNDRDDNQARLLRENGTLKEQLQAVHDAERSKTETRAEWDRNELHLREELDRVTKMEFDQRKEKVELEDIVMSLREDLRRAQRDLDSSRRTQDSSATDSGETQARLAEAAATNDALRTQLTELQIRVEKLKLAESAAEAENREMRDENFKMRRNLEDAQSRHRETEALAAQRSSGQETLSHQLHSQKGVNDLLRQTRDESDKKVLHLEEEKRHLTVTVQDLKKETQALWHSMREASAENDQYREALSITNGAGRGAPLGGVHHAAVSPTPSRPYFPSPVTTPGASVGFPSVQDTAKVDDALKNIEERVSRLVSTINPEIASWQTR